MLVEESLALQELAEDTEVEDQLSPQEEASGKSSEKIPNRTFRKGKHREEYGAAGCARIGKECFDQEVLDRRALGLSPIPEFIYRSEDEEIAYSSTEYDSDLEHINGKKPKRVRDWSTYLEGKYSSKQEFEYYRRIGDERETRSRLESRKARIRQEEEQAAIRAGKRKYSKRKTKKEKEQEELEKMSIAQDSGSSRLLDPKGKRPEKQGQNPSWDKWLAREMSHNHKLLRRTAAETHAISDDSDSEQSTIVVPRDRTLHPARRAKDKRDASRASAVSLPRLGKFQGRGQLGQTGKAVGVTDDGSIQSSQSPQAGPSNQAPSIQKGSPDQYLSTFHGRIPSDQAFNINEESTPGLAEVQFLSENPRGRSDGPNKSNSFDVSPKASDPQQTGDLQPGNTTFPTSQFIPPKENYQKVEQMGCGGFDIVRVSCKCSGSWMYLPGQDQIGTEGQIQVLSPFYMPFGDPEPTEPPPPLPPPEPPRSFEHLQPAKPHSQAGPYTQSNLAFAPSSTVVGEASKRPRAASRINQGPKNPRNHRVQQNPNHSEMSMNKMGHELMNAGNSLQTGAEITGTRTPQAQAPSKYHQPNYMIENQQTVPRDESLKWVNSFSTQPNHMMLQPTMPFGVADASAEFPVPSANSIQGRSTGQLPFETSYANVNALDLDLLKFNLDGTELPLPQIAGDSQQAYQSFNHNTLINQTMSWPEFWPELNQNVPELPLDQSQYLGSFQLENNLPPSEFVHYTYK